MSYQLVQKRKKTKSSVPFVPYEARAEKASEAICKCCIGKLNIEEDDTKLLTCILQAVFPVANKEEVERLVRQRAGPADTDMAPADAFDKVRADMDSYTGDQKVRVSDSNQPGELGDMLLKEQKQDASQYEEKSNSLV